MQELKYKKLNPNAITPERKYSTDSGYDLAACLDSPIIIPPAITYKLDTPELEIDYDEIGKEYFTGKFIYFKTQANKALIPTGIAIDLPEPFYLHTAEGVDIKYKRGGLLKVVYEVQIRPRSGLANDHFVFCHFGTIDQQYKGELKINLYNFSNKPFIVEHGMRIAQMVVNLVVLPDKLVEVTGLTASSRGTQGYGSTGVI